MSAGLFPSVEPRGRRSHADLVALAARWLHGTRKCAVVATERMAWKASESPDAIGWTPDGSSILVECKTSVADYLADLRKPSRCGAPAMGRERWYLTEDGLLAGRELPVGWGWLAVRNGRVFRAAHSEPRAWTDDTWRVAEMPFLVALTRKASGGYGGITALADPESDGVLEVHR